MIELLNAKYGCLLDLNAELLRERAALYSSAIIREGAPLEDCVGFIDCTKVRISMPGGPNMNQRACYSGHKRFHCLSYQTLTTPDGLIFALYGPVVGRRYDLTLLLKGVWNETLQHSLITDNRQYYIYGDGAYQLRPWIQRPFVGNCTDEQKMFNKKMSSVRVSFEHNYKDLKQQWCSQDFRAS